MRGLLLAGIAVAFIIVSLIILGLISLVSATGGLNCSIKVNTSCTDTAVVYLKNETGGWHNAHAQNSTVDTYPYAMCCASNDYTLSNSCEDETVLKLSASTNAHVQIGNYSGPGAVYTVNVCLSSSPGDLSCIWISGSCPSGYECLGSMASSESGDNNITNAHLSGCGNYTKSICCRIPNTVPTVSIVAFNETTAYASTPISCNTTITDPDAGDSLTAYYKLYKNNTQNDTGSTPVSNSTNTKIWNSTYKFTKNDVWICEVTPYDGTENGTAVNSSSLTILNTPPDQVVLSYPENGDEQFTNRTPRFNWSIPNDDDGDSLTYQIHVSLNSDGSDPLINETAITNNYYDQTTELNFATYYWRVRANDSEEYGTWSDIWNFTLVTYVDLNLTVDTVEFGTMNLGETSDTADGVPTPLTMENIGNTEANVTLNATALWTSAALDTKYFQFKANRTSSEPNSFNWGLSQTTWENVSDTYKLAVAYLNHTDSEDMAAVDLKVEVPGDEPQGVKESTIDLKVTAT